MPDIPLNPTIEQVRLNDGLTIFMGTVVRDLNKKTATPENVKEMLMCRFTEFLGQLLMQAPIYVKWIDNQGCICTSLNTLGEKASIVYGNDFGVPDSSKKSGSVGMGYPITFKTDTGWNGIEISKAYMMDNELYILISETPKDKWLNFVRQIPGQKSIALTINALMSIQIEKSKARKAEEFTYKIDKLIKVVRPISINHLQEAINLIKEINQEGQTVDIYYKTETLCIWLVQEIFSYGSAIQFSAYRVQPTEEIQGENNRNEEEINPSTILSQLGTHVDKAINNLSAFVIESDDEIKKERNLKINRLQFRLKSLNGCFLAFQVKTKPLADIIKDIESTFKNPKVIPNDIPLFLLSIWSNIHEHFRSQQGYSSQKANSENPENVWDICIEQTRKYLSQYLASVSWHSEDQDSEHPTTFRNWLQLWFFLQILTDSRKRDILADDLIFIRTELAYGIRESLRFACFGNRLDYYYHRPSFNTAMQAVIDYHAHWIIGLPRELNIRSLLEEIGNKKRTNSHRTPEEHFQHVINVYLFGHFILSLAIIDNSNPEIQKMVKDTNKNSPITITHKLACTAPDLPPGAETVKMLLRTFSLAALFHDIGHIFFPYSPDMHFNLYHEENTIKRSLIEIEKILRQQGSEIVKRYIQTLEDANYFNSKKESHLGRWLEPQIEDGKPDHGLLGAWYLHQLATTINGYSKDIVKDAVRAVLLHNAMTVPIDSDIDPVASLLTLCHELSDWENSSVIALPSTTKNPPQTWIPVAKSRVPGYKWMDFPHLEFTAENGLLQGTLRFSTEQENVEWPTIVFQVQSLEQLEYPTYISWLLKFQNIGRIKNSNKSQWAPKIIIKGNSPTFLGSRGLTTEKLLILLARDSKLPFRTAISRWLTEGKPFARFKEEEKSVDQECILIESFPGIDFRDTLYDWISQMEQEAFNIIRKLQTEDLTPKIC